MAGAFPVFDKLLVSLMFMLRIRVCHVCEGAGAGLRPCVSSPTAHGESLRKTLTHVGSLLRVWSYRAWRQPPATSAQRSLLFLVFAGSSPSLLTDVVAQGFCTLCFLYVVDTSASHTWVCVEVSFTSEFSLIFHSYVFHSDTHTQTCTHAHTCAHTTNHFLFHFQLETV